MDSVKSAVVDARGLLCPLPVIRLQDAVRDLALGSRVEVLCSDPGALSDIPAWCRINGHELIDSRRAGREIVITVEVGDGGD